MYAHPLAIVALLPPVSDRVPIVNSPYGPGRTTSSGHALRLRRRGRAYLDSAGRLVLTPHALLARLHQDQGRMLTAAGYDCIDRPMSLREIHGIPLRSPDPTSPAVPICRRSRSKS